MGIDKKGNFIPDWTEEAPKKGSFRSIFKWGDPKGFKHPNRRLYAHMKQIFQMTDADFQKKQKEGNDTVVLGRPVGIAENHVNKFREFVGSENVSCDDYSRVYYSYGKTFEESMELRDGVIKEVADVVLHPRDKEDVKKIVRYCNENNIPVHVYGAGSSVNMGLRPEKGGVSLALNTHMNKILKIDETSQVCTVQPGMRGPEYEEQLNKAPEKFGCKRRYTCGHFPQSFEFSSVGGWVVTLGSGQQSSYYGDATDIVFAQEYVTPAGDFYTEQIPAYANGPKPADFMKGSEGCYGILVEVQMKIFRYMPENRRSFGFIFPTWEAGVDACREIAQGEFGSPSVFRLSDPEETDIALKLYGVEGTFIDTLMKFRGFKPMQRCLYIGHTEGEKGFSKNVLKNVKKVAKKYGAMYITGYPIKGWRKGRYADPYMREDLADYGIVTDTLETGVTWSNLHEVHQKVRSFVKSRPNTVCMTHGSHFYPQGTNLYFIFIMKESDIEAYKEFQSRMIDELHKSGGSLSHHHGVGRMIAPWMEDHLGSVQMGALRALKKYFDPNGIMNPGAQLGLDDSKNNDASYRFKKRAIK